MRITTYKLYESVHRDCYLLGLTNLDFTHQDLPLPSVSMRFSQLSWGHVNATLHQACHLLDYTPHSSTRLLHYPHIKPQISWTEQRWSSWCPHSFFKHERGVGGEMGRASFTQCVKLSVLLGIGEQFTKKKKSYLGHTHFLLSLNLRGMLIIF